MRQKYKQGKNNKHRRRRTIRKTKIKKEKDHQETQEEQTAFQHQTGKRNEEERIRMKQNNDKVK